MAIVEIQLRDYTAQMRVFTEHVRNNLIPTSACLNIHTKIT